MGFLGVWQGSGRARIAIERRANYLYASELRLSLDHRVLLCYDCEGHIDLPPHLFCATANAGYLPSADRTALMYYRHGRRFLCHLPDGRAVALYDSRKGRLYLYSGGGGLFLEETGEGILFSTERRLLRAPHPVDVAILK